MHWRYDEDLVEGVVNLYSSHPRKDIPSLQVSRFQMERERLYSIADPDERSAAFFKLFLKWFVEWGGEDRLKRPLAEFPLIPGSLKILAFRKAKTKAEQGAELFVHSHGDRNGVIALQAEMFQQDARLQALLRHELTHIQDMLDPAFGYSPEFTLPRQRGAQQRLTILRYRLLWDVSIDGRILNSGRATIATREQRWAEFNRAYGFWTEAQRAETFESVWTDAHPRHEHLLAIAADPRDLEHHTGMLPGAPCPLCTFPTFEWVATPEMRPETVKTISTQFPQWTQEQGACKRCVEIYEWAKMEQPATLCI